MFPIQVSFIGLQIVVIRSMVEYPHISRCAQTERITFLSLIGHYLYFVSLPNTR